MTPFERVIVDNMMEINLIIVLLMTATCSVCLRKIAQFGPPAVFVIGWRNLSQHLLKGNSNLGADFMPVLSGTKKVSMRVPTCSHRFNGIQLTRHLREGFFLSSHSTSQPLPAADTFPSDD
jgi:hypothetical protein